MPNRRPRRWIRFAALGLSTYLAGCAGGPSTAPAITPAAEVSVGGLPRVEDIDLLAIADRLRASGDARNAVAMYHQAHLANPQSVTPLIRLGDTLMELGANAEAAEAYGRALAVEPNSSDALLGLGVARVLLGQPQFAIEPFEAARAVDAADFRAYNGLGVALDMTGNHEAAQEIYRAGLEIAPDNAKILNNLGLSLALSGKTAESVALLERVNAAPAATAVTRQNLALAYGLSGQLQAAERVARIDLRDPAVKHNLAFYAAQRTTAAGDGTLARSLGVQRNGVQYAASEPPATDVAPATPPQAIEPLPDQATAKSLAAEPAATGAPISLLPYFPEHPGGGEPGDAQIARRPDLPADPEPSAPSNRDQASAQDGIAAMQAMTVSPAGLPSRGASPSAVRAPSPDAAPLYRVQLAAYRSAEEAKAGWRSLTAAEPGLLGRFTPIVHRVDLGPDKGVFFRLQTGGFVDRQTAQAFCRDLQTRRIDCLVVRAASAASNDTLH